MQIVIPMSGLGSRFRAAGYTDIKPLITVHGRPIIEYVVKMFSGDNDFIFVCREEHLESTPVRAELQRICPQGKIFGVPAERVGPVGAVARVFDKLDPDQPTIVNYCDFFQLWDFENFKKDVSQSGVDGSVVCYKGFHPHLLHEKNVYASCKLGPDGLLEEIREKYSYTEDKTLTPQSGGTYYFKSGQLVVDYFGRLMERKISLNDEFYVSLVYNLLVEDGLKVGVYSDVSHFCQWGTPEDLQEYEYWYEIFESYGVES